MMKVSSRPSQNSPTSPTTTMRMPTRASQKPIFSRSPERPDWRSWSPTSPARMSRGAEGNSFQKTFGVLNRVSEMEAPVGESAQSTPPGTTSSPAHLTRNRTSRRKTFIPRTPLVAGQRAARVLDHVVREHLLRHVRVLGGDVLVHLRVLLEVEELRLGPVVAGEHRVAIVARPDVVVVAGREIRAGLLRLAAVQKGVEILALERAWRLDAQGAQYRRGDVVGGDEEVARLPGALAPWVLDHEHRVRQLDRKSVV